MAKRFRVSTLSKGRLRGRLALLFAALAVPTGLLAWQAWGQLRWEAFHHYRELAEDLTQTIDGALAGMIADTEARSFADYSFLVVEGDTQSNFLTRSPLSAFPVNGALPGVVGYFQLDGEGRFSTPLLPANGTAPAAVGLPPEELALRQQLAQRILAVLSDNRLVQASPPHAQREDDDMPAEARPRAPERRVGAQAAFDELSRARESKAAPAAAAADAGSEAAGDAAGSARASDGLASSLGKVADLNLETPYRDEPEEQATAGAPRVQQAARNARKERVALPETRPAASPESAVPGIVGTYGQDVRIDTFQSEIDPFEFSLLDSGHFVLFRKVWRDRERFIQGMLIERDAFLAQVVDARFPDSPTAGMSDLLVAWDDDVIHSGRGEDALRYTSGTLQSPAPLLYRSRLSSPLDRLELIYRIRHLPPGPGASVLAWVTVVIAAVLCGGFLLLYRLGAGQIDLARQQQDFVSAVSHELKTPLTSIRMYGEMLKEGWADPDKRQQYYEYIHDESERLARLIANVLQLASITRNEPKLESKPVEAGRLMTVVEKRIASQVRNAGFELVIERDGDTDHATVHVDTDCFMQIVINLVDNAIKFSGKSSRRSIVLSTGRSASGAVRFAVRDFGPGVPKNQMKKIFRLFYRAGNELTRDTVGTGIGLAIVHELTLAMGGRVDVVNRHPGAEFIVELPSKSP